MITDALLTVAEVAADLRCSKGHVHNAINGKVAGVLPIPAIRMGRRTLVRRSALESWKRLSEKGSLDGMMSASPEVDAPGPMKGDFHAA